MGKFKLLNADIDVENGESQVRILLDDRNIKYIDIAAGVFPPDDIGFEPTLRNLLLPILPQNDWISGSITLGNEEPSTGPVFTPDIGTELDGITPIWHEKSVEYLDLEIVTRLHADVYEVVCSRLYGHTHVVMKHARFPWEIPFLSAETESYRQISGQSFCPKFLGHVTESGRPMGFLVEYIPNARHARIEDLALCQQTLSQLHQLGFYHGDVNKHNFLITEGKAVLIDFAGMRPCDDPRSFQEELDSLEGELLDRSGRGGSYVVDSSGNMIFPEDD